MLDISADAIGSGLARDLLKHYASVDGPIQAIRMPLLDDCHFTLTVIFGETFRDVQKILVTSSLIARAEDDMPEHEQYTGRSVGITSHTIDLEKGTAQATTTENSFRLTEAQLVVIRNGIERIFTSRTENN